MGALVEVFRVGGGGMPHPKKNLDLPDFIPERAHLLFQGIYGDYRHHNYGSHLDRGVPENAILKSCWCRLAAHWNIWYSMPSGLVGCRFTTILNAEWHGVLGRSWNSKKPLVFSHVVPAKMLGVRMANEIRAQITRRMDL